MAKHPESFFDMDVTKFLGDFKIPGLDLDSIVTSQRRNIEALTAANQLALEGFQAVVKRQVEILRQTLEEVASASKEMTEAGAPQDKAARQAEMAKETFERSLANMRELSEIMARANSDAFDLLNKRFSQNLEEVRDMMLKYNKMK
ncbi:MAG: phasin family protein [Rhodospirillales bacterium]|nr:phasin family protein [Rhodospirillales bacterium]